MKVPLGWLRDYVELSAPVGFLAERLTLAGLEVAGIRFTGVPAPGDLHIKSDDAGPTWDRDKVIVARVQKVEKHPNADRLTLVTLDYGANAPRVVVTGAPNLKVGDSGQNVVLGLAGASYFDGHAAPKVLRKLEAKPIRGIMNDAMVMSEFELGISDEHEGIIILEGDAPPPGTPYVDVAGEVIVEIDVLPNMARCLSMIGVAREVAALTEKKLCIPREALNGQGEAAADQVEVQIADPSLCARYAAVILKGVQLGRAPAWMRARLASAGMRPINNVVDCTNYVMLEWGQPLHAFDLDRLIDRAGGKKPCITVRPAHPGETLKTLDGNLRELKPDHLVIADSVGPVALAGVMGGADTEVTAQTQNILLESANFDFRSIRRTMRHFDLPSEASVRFAKGVHPDMVMPAAERAAALMAKYAGAAVGKGIVDCYPAPITSQVIELPLADVERKLGMRLPAEEIVRILTALDFQVARSDGEKMRVTTPGHRLDIQDGPADLIEEVARVYGYDRLPATLLSDSLPEQKSNTSLDREERVRDILVDLGLQEVITYALTEPAREAALLASPPSYVTLANPISSERVVMRQTVLAGVLEVAAANRRHTDNLALFEIGSVYLPNACANLPDEPRRLALVVVGSRDQAYWNAVDAGKAPVGFFDLKGLIETLAAEMHLPSATYLPSKAAFLHPGRSAEMRISDTVVGDFGQMHPRVAETLGFGSADVLVAELDLEALIVAMPDRYAYEPVPRFPAALRDIAVIVAEDVAAERVTREIRAAGLEILRGVRLFDVYRGDSIPAGTKSLAFALSYQAADRTLVDKEVDKAHRKIEDRLQHVLKAQIRGKETN